MINLLSRYSLDAPIVAVVWLKLFSLLSAANVQQDHYLVLFAATWLAYAADRIFDGILNNSDKPQTGRHGLYGKHIKVFIVIWVIVFLVSVTFSIYRFSIETLYAGFLLLGLIALYFSIVHVYPGRRLMHLHKECSVAIIYSLGVTFFVWMNEPQHIGKMFYAQLLFTATCLLNLLYISDWEYEIDSGQGYPGLRARPFLFKSIQRVVSVFVFAGVLVGFIFMDASIVMLSLLLSLVLLLLLGRCGNLKSETRRSFADIALMVPFLLLYA